ncbi:uncharacterized protein LOC133714075 isoform X5 [Rosa rugosa]|uniref:uncharacterized protein LOC133714075 isoform X5 n=1 Tax=Rosa rugosa TaxID=74645 RepID=UPI002B40B8DE|nr:uncharacterized protein LOC133714075 isoform X5 [Rosa rugosa]
MLSDVRGNNLTSPASCIRLPKSIFTRMVGMERLGESFIRKVRLRYEVNIVEFVVGLPAADAPKKISRVHKRGWRYILSLSKSTESLSSVSKPTETAPATPEVQPA